jgi:hypothetical protein
MSSPQKSSTNRKGLLSEKGEKKKAWFVLNHFYESYPR